MIYVVFLNGPFYKTPICAYTTEEQAVNDVNERNNGSHYGYYYEEIEMRG